MIKPSLVNEALFGFNQIAVVNDTLDWAGIGNANSTFGIAGGQPIAGLSALTLEQRTHDAPAPARAIRTRSTARISSTTR